ncbi:hypothetical protein ACIBEJ_41710 [Nonomuraea sp. NPDC050790]|uniref:hypothetical protein n=1 Tax=Nonomuraea sp. NPDC050790 TaxID=3364371 RepID=UPI0037B7FC76
MKVPFDVGAYHERVRSGPCFICAIVAGDPAYDMEKVFYEDEHHLAFLGSRQGNAHLHWHVAALPPGVPYERQRYHALMAENGVLEWSPEEGELLATRLRQALT